MFDKPARRAGGTAAAYPPTAAAVGGSMTALETCLSNRRKKAVANVDCDSSYHVFVLLFFFQKLYSEIDKLIVAYG